MGAAAKGLMSLGAQVTDYAKFRADLEFQQDEVDVKQADNATVTRLGGLLDDPETGFLTKRGRDAVDAYGDMEEALARVKVDGLTELKRPRAQKMFSQVAAERLAAAQSRMAKHVAVERDRWLNETSDARMSLGVTEAANSYLDSDVSEKHIGTAVGELMSVADRQGWSPERFAEKRLELVSTARSAIARRFAKDDPGLAATYIARHEKDFTWLERARLEEELKRPLELRQAEIDVDRAIPDIGNQTSGKAGPADDGVAVVRSVYPAAVVTSNYRPADHPLSKANPTSWHTKSHAAVDVKPIAGMTFSQYLQGFQDAGYRIIEAKNEVGAGRSAHATGDHWHVVLGARGGEPQQGPRRWNLDLVFGNIDKIAKEEGWTPERREMAKDRATARASRDDMLRSRQEQDADEEASKFTLALGERFTDLSQIPASVRARLSGTAMREYTNLAQRNAKPTEPIANGNVATTLELMRIGQPAAFAELPLGKFQGLVTRGEMQGLLKAQADIATGDPNGGIRSKVASTISMFGVDAGISGDKEEQKQKRVAVQKIMEGELKALVKKKGGIAPTDDELYQSFLSATRDVTLTVETNALGFIPTGTEQKIKPRYALGAEDVPPDRRAKIVAGYRRTYGAEPSEEKIGEIYRNGKGRWW